MTVWLQTRSDGYFLNINTWMAFEGFTERGHECIPFRVEQLAADLMPRPQHLGELGNTVVHGPLRPGDIVVGGVGTVHQALRKLGVEPPPALDYPEVLLPYLGRTLEKTTWSVFAELISGFEVPIFVKPVSHKTWTGQLVSEFKDLIPIGNPEPAFPVWISSPVEFVSEYRCMVLRDELRAMRNYKGDSFVTPSRGIVKAMVEAMRVYDLAAYSLDVGVTAKGESLLVEVNDAYALGCYGADSNVYAQMIEARWAQMVPYEQAG